jgi:hypothetical protein
MSFDYFAIVFVLLLLLIYTIIYWFSDLSSSWFKYLKSMSNLGIVVALVDFIISEINQSSAATVDFISNMEDQQESGFIDIEQLFMSNYPELLPLYKEINQHNPMIQSLKVPENIDPIKKVQLETNVCNIMIQRLENIYLSILKFPDYQQIPEFKEWITTWKQWFKSSTMKKVWNLNKKYYFSSQTANFIDNYIINNQSNGKLSTINNY